MKENNNLQRFIDAQEPDWVAAFSEIKDGRKRTHWMWYLFPQIKGLGHSDMSRYYALDYTQEAKAYLSHPVLGHRLIQLCRELLKLETNDPYQVFGTPDHLKLKSSMTLFSLLPDTHPVFRLVLEKFFFGMPDKTTIDIIEKQAPPSII